MAFARQRLGEHLRAAKNKHVTTEEVLDAVFSVRSMSNRVLNI
jgi:hypothetical protein